MTDQMMSYFWMVYNGYVHTDMHDGNFVYIIDEEDDCNNKVALFDYGLGFSLPSYGKNGLAMLLWKAFIKRNTKSTSGLVSTFPIISFKFPFLTTFFL